MILQIGNEQSLRTIGTYDYDHTGEIVVTPLATDNKIVVTFADDMQTINVTDADPINATITKTAKKVTLSDATLKGVGNFWLGFEARKDAESEWIGLVIDLRTGGVNQATSGTIVNGKFVPGSDEPRDIEYSEEFQRICAIMSNNMDDTAVRVCLNTWPDDDSISVSGANSTLNTDLTNSNLIYINVGTAMQDISVDVAYTDGDVNKNFSLIWV